KDAHAGVDMDPKTVFIVINKIMVSIRITSGERITKNTPNQVNACNNTNNVIVLTLLFIISTTSVAFS
ncbi:MAG: hypothetical protein AB1668_07555, partial [Nanoarchaeota archaeon]